MIKCTRTDEILFALVIPLERSDFIRGDVDGRKRVNNMSAQERVDISGHIFGIVGPILSPVGHVTNEFERVLVLFAP